MKENEQYIEFVPCELILIVGYYWFWVIRMVHFMIWMKWVVSR